VVESNTIELSDKVDALAARLDKIEKSNLLAEVATLKQNVAQIAQYLQNAATRQRGTPQRQPAAVAQQPPRPRPRTQAQAQPQGQPQAQPQPRPRPQRPPANQGQPRPNVTPAERIARRAAYIAGRANLNEQQAGTLNRVLKAQQDRFVSLSQAIREGRIAKDDVAKQRDVIRQQTQQEFDAFLGTLNEDQKQKVLAALQPRKTADPKTRPPRPTRPQTPTPPPVAPKQ
jgi:DNA primase